ncbi:MAG: hypothetical protein RIS36_249 [Pseudomonadota bacterium]
MRVALIHVPRAMMTIGDAMRMTKWALVTSNFFFTQLNDIAEQTTEPFSLELYAKGTIVYICIAAEEETLQLITKAIYGWWADVEIEYIDDYTTEINDQTVAVGADLDLEWPDIYPLQNFRAFAWDSMAPVVTTLSRISEFENVLVQVVVRPLRDTPLLHAKLGALRKIEQFCRLFRTRTWLKKDIANQSIKLVKEKCLSRLFKINYRVTAFADLPKNASKKDAASLQSRLALHVRAATHAVKYLNTADENRLRTRPLRYGPSVIKLMQQRRFNSPFMVSAIELSTLWHPPSAGTLPNTALVLSRKAPPPRTLPSTPNDPQISFFGVTNYRDQTTPFGFRRFDRRRHLYALGKSGNGKSCFLQLLIKADIDNGFGCAVLDPHGDLSDEILKTIPKHRLKDVVIFDPSDLEHPPSFNPMIPIRPDLKVRVMLSFLDTFKRVFGDGWSEKMDHILRYAINALLNIPGASIVSLRRLLSDDEFRREVVSRSTDESVRRFWEVEFPSRRQEFEEGPVSQLLNRLDELLATDMIRNILGQPTNTFDFRDFIDSRKIVIFKISKGVLGAENASLLGSLIIWKLYEAAMSRADIPVESRQDFYVYVDEFQNFATPSFGEILSESRKYRLCLTFANQFLGQLPQTVKETIFGNVANLVCFRVGADDAATVAQEFKPRFGSEDLLNLALREFYVKMSIDGEVLEAFSGYTLDVQNAATTENSAKACVEHSRSKYALPLSVAQEQLALSEIMSPRAMSRS